MNELDMKRQSELDMNEETFILSLYHVKWKTILVFHCRCLPDRRLSAPTVIRE